MVLSVGLQVRSSFTFEIIQDDAWTRWKGLKGGRVFTSSEGTHLDSLKAKMAGKIQLFSGSFLMTPILP